MTEQTIQSRDINVTTVFQDYYVVPDFQREYVWGTDEVEQLIHDINAEMTVGGGSHSPEYFIGSIVVCPGTRGTLDLIDGQQRMTTLFIVLCAIRDRLMYLNQAVPGALAPQISSVSTDARGQDQFRYRLELQYHDSGGILLSIGRGEGAGSPQETTRSIDSILNAYDVIRGFLSEALADDPIRIKAFYGYLTNKVKLIRIQTEDVAKALKIFETINDRGVGLDAMDLLKNLLFMKADRAEFDKLKMIWKEMQDEIHKMGEKPLRFLRYFILSRYSVVDPLREDEIYGWLAKNEAMVGYAQHPLAFAKELRDGAKAYHHFLDGEDHEGTRNAYVENLRLLGGKTARQHLILLLATRHLTRSMFDRLAREVEELFFVYVITREATRDFERDFARWVPELREVANDADLMAFIALTFAPAKARLASRFEDAFRRLSAHDVQTYRLRYILAKLTQHVEIAAYGEIDGTRWLKSYIGNGFEIEHIFPQGAGDAARDEFGPHINANVIAQLGNLTLVEKSINASLGNKAFSAKRLVYPQSKLLLTHAISERPAVGVNTQIDRAVESLEWFEYWNEATVVRRQEALTKIAQVAWHVLPATTNSIAR